MSKLPSANYDKVVKVLVRIVTLLVIKRVVISFYILLTHRNTVYCLVAEKTRLWLWFQRIGPWRGMLRAIIGEIGLSVEEFNKLVEKTWV
jgi:hypothetical protein